MRLFLIWYQILGESSPIDMQPLFEALVPGIIPNHSASLVFANFTEVSPSQLPATTYFYSDQPVMSETQLYNASSVQPIEMEPLVPALTNEPQPKDITCYYLQCLMDFMVSQVTKVQWKEQKEYKQLRSFQFIFEQFRLTYIRFIFPNMNDKYSLYNDNFELPVLRSSELENHADPNFYAYFESQANAKAVIIRWFSRYLSNEVEVVPRRGSVDHANTQRVSTVGELNYNPTEYREPTPFELEVVRTTLNLNRPNVNLTHELFRQAFLLPFSQAPTMRRVVSVYKDWINKNISELPLFMEEPFDAADQDVRVGLSKVLRAFITNAANIFLMYIPPDKPMILEEQVEMCKRILNLYRFMVMKIDMDKETWEQLLLVMLRITALVLSEVVPSRKEDTLGGRLAPAFFQTLIVTWIRANLNVSLHLKLWENFQTTMTMLTEWDELIREWSKTMDTITRVMSRMVYNINLHDLPLERIGDKRDRRRKTNSKVISNSSSVSTPSTNPNDRNDIPDSGKRAEFLRVKRTNSGNDSFLSKDARYKQRLVRSYSDSRIFVEIWKTKVRARQLRNNIIRDSRKMSKSYECIRSPSYSPCFSDSSASHSRSPSPTPSSGIDTGSLKDSPMNLDGVSLNSNPSTNSVKCVINGGTYRGWAPDSAVTLWRRMLGVLGDINQLKDPLIHAQVLECLAKIVEDLIKVRDNLGIDSSVSSSGSLLVPPINFFSPWLFKALMLGPEYKRGKLIAYKTLCLIALRRHDVPPFPDFLCHFYRSLHAGLVSKEMVSHLYECEVH